MFFSFVMSCVLANFLVNIENGVQCIASKDDYGKFLRFTSKQEAENAGHMFATDVTE